MEDITSSFSSLCSRLRREGHGGALGQSDTQTNASRQASRHLKTLEFESF